MNSHLNRHDTELGQPQMHPPSVETGQGAFGARARGHSPIPVFRVARTLWPAVIAVGMLTVFRTGTEDLDMQGQDARWAAQLDDAATNHELNEAGTSGAPQQSVANGWHTNDLLETQTHQAVEAAGDQRDALTAFHQNQRTLITLALLLGLGILGDRALRPWDTPSPAERHASRPDSESQP